MVLRVDQFLILKSIIIFAEDHILGPMQSVFDTPMPSHQSLLVLEGGRYRADLISDVVIGLAFASAPSLHIQNRRHCVLLLYDYADRLINLDRPMFTSSSTVYGVGVLSHQFKTLKISLEVAIKTALIALDGDKIGITRDHNLLGCFFGHVRYPW